MRRWLLRLRCMVSGHDLRDWQNFTKVHKRIYCAKCGGDWFQGWYEGGPIWTDWDADCARFVEVLHQTKVRPRNTDTSTELP